MNFKRRLKGRIHIDFHRYGDKRELFDTTRKYENVLCTLNITGHLCFKFYLLFYVFHWYGLCVKMYYPLEEIHGDIFIIHLGRCTAITVLNIFFTT